MKDKNYIRDDGRIRDCYANVAKMNIGEYMILKITSKYFWKRALSGTLEVFWEGIQNLGIGIINVLLVLALPIALPIAGFIEIRKAKTEVEKHQRMVKAIKQ